MPKSKPIVETTLLVPEPMAYTSWLILGLDMSVSRTGYVLYFVGELGPKLLAVGSIKPVDTDLPVWARCSMIAHSLLDICRPLVEGIRNQYDDKSIGLMISAEAATPRNDFLSSINRVLNALILGTRTRLWDHKVHTLYINASTLRSTLGLTQRGATNKVENIAKAYTFIDEQVWPGLDTDSCDAVLMGAMGVFAAQILMGDIDLVPKRYQELLCDAKEQIKGSKKRPVVEKKGLFHLPRYWLTHHPGPQEVKLYDASQPRKKKPQKLLVEF